MTATWQTPTAPTGFSPLAQGVGGNRAVGSARTQPIFGMVVHTTGGQFADRQRRTGRPAADDALDYYLDRGIYHGKSDGFPHYLIGYDGTIYPICTETRIAWHAGWLRGRARWDGWTAPAWWSTVWGPRGARTPADLVPPRSSSPNDAYIGVELLGPELARSGYTDAQYAALARLVSDVFRRNGLTLAQPPNRQLLGHEDVEPILRADRGGGWDPGAHRGDPRFSWPRLWALIQGGPTPPPPAPVPLPGQVPPPPAPPRVQGGDASIFSAPFAVFSSVAGIAEASAAFAAGERDPNRLTDLIFHARHRERGGRRLAQTETALVQEWLWIRDNIVANVLRATAAVGGTPPASAFLPSVRRIERFRALVPLLDRHRGTIPLWFLLGWIAAEKDGVLGGVSKVALRERGFFEISEEEARGLGLDLTRLSNDPDYSAHAGVRLVERYMGQVRGDLPQIPAGSELFWRFVKLYHSCGRGGALSLVNGMRARGIALTWANLKAFEVSDGPRVNSVFLPSKPGRFGHNVDFVFSEGPALARQLGR